MKVQSKFLRQLSYAVLACGLLAFISSCSDDHDLVGDGNSPNQDVIFVAAEDGVEISDDFGFPATNELRKRYVQLNEAAFNTAALEGKEGDKVVLNLFDDVSITVATTSIEDKEEGIKVWRGDIKAEVYGRAILTVYRSAIIGRIQIDDKMYRIWPANEDYLTITEVSSSDFKLEACEKLIDDGINNTIVEGTKPSSQLRGNGVIRVLLLFPNQLSVACRTIFGMNFSTILANAYEANANEVYDAYGNVNVTLDIVVRCINYNAVGGSLTSDLNYTSSNATIAALRNSTNSDMVAMIVPDGDFCGRGQYNTPPINTADINRIHTVTVSECALDNYSFVHELGHNMGMRHDRTAENYTSTATCNFGYLINVNGSVASRTVMAYGSSCGGCERVGRFSNNVTTRIFGGLLTIKYGESCSSSTTGFFGPSDNQNFLLSAAPVICNYR